MNRTRLPRTALSTLSCALALACGTGSDAVFDNDRRPSDERNQPRDQDPAREPSDITAEGRPIVEPPPINVAANDPSSHGPMDATPSPDGSQIYYTALLSYEGTLVPAVFHVAAEGDAPRVLAAGGLLTAPVGIATSLDGERLFVADSASGEAGNGGAILTLPASGGTPSVLSGTAGYAPAGLVVAEVDGQERLLFTGRTPDSAAPGVYSVGIDGGEVESLADDANLTDPGGVAVTHDGAIYVTDALGKGEQATVVRIADGRAASFVEDIGVGFPAGLTLTLDDSTLIVSGIDPRTRTDVVYFVDTASAEVAVMTEPVGAFTESAGLHRAHDADVFAWADSEANGSGTVYVLKP